MVSASRRDGASADRGQLILIAALLVATAVLGGVVLLNTIHATPDLSAQTDAKSVSDADRVNQHVQTDLRRLFLATGIEETGFPVPYGESGPLEAATEQYSESYMTLSSTNRSALVDVQFNDTASATGSVAYANESTDEFVDANQEWMVVDAGAVPRLSLHLDALDPGDEITVEVNDSATTLSFQVDRNGISGDLACGADPPLDLTLTDGAGEVRGEEEYCAVELDPSTWEGLSEYSIRFDVAGAPEGTYAVSGTEAGAGSPACADPCETDVIVDPAFELGYEDPNVSFESTFRLYERDRR